MKNISRFLRKRKIVTIFCMIFFIMFVLRKITELEPIEILKGMTGETQAYSIHIQIAFFVFIYFIQYLNIDLILYMSKNMSYLCTRYGNRQAVWNEFVKRTLLINLLFLFILLAVTGLNSMFESIPIQMMWYELFSIIIKIYGKCYLFSMLVFFFVIKFHEEMTFGLMAGIAFGFILLRRFVDVSLLGLESFGSLIADIGIQFIILLFITMFLRNLWEGEVEHED